MGGGVTPPGKAFVSSEGTSVPSGGLRPLYRGAFGPLWWPLEGAFGPPGMPDGHAQKRPDTHTHAVTKLTVSIIDCSFVI